MEGVDPRFQVGTQLWARSMRPYLKKITKVKKKE
jgi:hypothetical protein